MRCFCPHSPYSFHCWSRWPPRSCSRSDPSAAMAYSHRLIDPQPSHTSRSRRSRSAGAVYPRPATADGGVPLSVRNRTFNFTKGGEVGRDPRYFKGYSHLHGIPPNYIGRWQIRGRDLLVAIAIHNRKTLIFLRRQLVVNPESFTHCSQGAVHPGVAEDLWRVVWILSSVSLPARHTSTRLLSGPVLATSGAKSTTHGQRKPIRCGSYAGLLLWHALLSTSLRVRGNWGPQYRIREATLAYLVMKCMTLLLASFARLLSCWCEIQAWPRVSWYDVMDLHESRCTTYR